MKNCYFYIRTSKNGLLSNLPLALRSRPDLCEYGVFRINFEGKLILEKKEKIDDGFIYLCSDDSTITRKIFLHYFDALLAMHNAYIERISYIEASSLNNLRRLQHNVRTYNAAIQDDLTDLISLESMQQDWKDVVPYAESHIRNKIRQTAVTVLKTYKNSSLIKAELNVFDLIKEPNPLLEIYPHSIHKVVKLSFQPYFLDFLGLGIQLRCDNCIEKVLVDYSSISVVLGHIWNNAVKYARPSSSINITYSSNLKYVTTTITMLSYYIDPNEREIIFQEGVSGEWAKRMGKDGHGIGMFYIKRLTELNEGIFSIKAGDEKIYFEGVPYAYNSFKIVLRIAED